MSERPQPLHRRNRIKSQYDSYLLALQTVGHVTLENKALAYRVKAFASDKGIDTVLSMKPQIKLATIHDKETV